MPVGSSGEFFSLFCKKQNKWAWARNHFSSTNLDSVVAKEVGIKVTETPSVEFATEAKAYEANKKKYEADKVAVDKRNKENAGQTNESCLTETSNTTFEAVLSATKIEESSYTQNVIQGCTHDTNADANFDNVFLFDDKSGTTDIKAEYHKATVKEIPNTPNPTSTKKVLPNTGAEVNMLGVIMADITSALGASGLKRKND